MKMFAAFALMLLCAGLCHAQTEKPTFRRHYVNHTEVGVLLGRVRLNSSINAVSPVRNSFTAQMYHGIQLNRILSTGITIGMDWYKTALITPVTAGARWDLMRDNNTCFYAFADAGYGFALFNADSEGYATKGGFIANPGLALRFGPPDKNQFIMSLGYRRQHISVDKPKWAPDMIRREDRIYNRLSLRIGMAF